MEEVNAGAAKVVKPPVQEKRQEGDIDIDNSKHVLMNIATLYSERFLSDVCLVVGGVEYPAHRLILCASSDVFQIMLNSPMWCESNKKRIELTESAECEPIFGQFLEYFYTGQIRINHNCIMPLLTLGDKYNVKDLVFLCVKYMCEHIPHAAVHNQLVTWFQYTLSLAHYKAAQACENFVKWNFQYVASTSDFGNLTPEFFTRLLKQSDIVVKNEFTVYECVVCWLDAQQRVLETNKDSDVESKMKALVHQVMSYVRFPMMTPRQLAELLLSPLIKRHKEFFIEKMAIGMSYHNDQIDRVREVAQTFDGKLMFTPRLYTNEKWCTSMLLENYPQVQPYHIRTLVLSSHALYAEHGGEKTCDWIVDVYPKGVWFRKFFLIVWQGTVEVPESVLRTVRVSVTCKDPPGDGLPLRVKIGLLVWGIQDGVEHVMSVITRNHIFNEEEKVLNLDDIISFDELNNTVGTVNGEPRKSPFLVGEKRDVLKIQIVIAPLTEECCVDNEVVTLEAFMKDCVEPMMVNDG
ncbi:BTB/POZ domain-containing protein 17 isoform X2 [Macrosteles quadrilineatus]|nr:BTB/POZ domain-containing protein 17 isoform X2 [Macrosteles quadrilineatus]